MPEASGRGPILTKSLFKSGLDCPKRLWLDAHEPSLRKAPSVAAQSRMRAGGDVGKRARELYPGGLLAWSPGMSHEDAAHLTAKAIEGGATCLYEATFLADGCLARSDVIWRGPEGAWNIDEVKASKDKPGPDLVKRGYVHDLEFQRSVLRGAGHSVGLGRLVLMSRDYRWPGGDHVLDGLLVQKGVTAECQAIEEEVRESATEFKIILAKPEPPEVETDRRCNDCGYYDHCHKGQPADSITLLPSLHAKKLGELRKLGVRSLADIPADFKLTESQARVRDAHTTGVPFVSPELPKVLESIAFPAAFIDFEACMPAIPQYEGTGCYDTVCFQWSAHILDSPDAEPRHFEFLYDSATDPRAEFCETLWKSVQGAATLVVYSSYERTQLRHMAAAGIPRAAELLTSVEANGLDLETLVKEHVYLPEFRGRTSIKKVLPALAPGLSYEGLEIADGDTASAEFMRMISPGMPPGERERVRKALLEYCKLDTLAMVEIYRALQKLAREPGRP